MTNFGINGLHSRSGRGHHSRTRKVNKDIFVGSKDKLANMGASTANNVANSLVQNLPSPSSGVPPSDLTANIPNPNPSEPAKSQDVVLSARNGNDTLTSDSGNDISISYSDAGEPAVLGKQVVNQNEPLKDSNDTLIGGRGADNFFFALEIDAKPEILAKHTQADGRINGAGVAGENNKSHDHWLESIGNDTIADFNLAEGDKITIKGHTVDLFAVEQQGSDYLLRLRSNQGNANQSNPNGAHDGDLVGTITVKGAADKYTRAQLQGAITTDNMVHYVADGRGVETVSVDPLLGRGMTTGMAASSDITNTQATSTYATAAIAPAADSMAGMAGMAGSIDLMSSAVSPILPLADPAISPMGMVSSNTDNPLMSPDLFASQTGAIATSSNAICCPTC
jgi:hypothetical protein